LRILVGITGGIAAYKAPAIIRGFSELGHDVKVLPTQNALRFIGAATLEALSHNAVDPDLFSDVESVKHIALAQEADLIVVAPATAAFIARYSAGLADDLLLNVLLATKARVVIAPAMHTEMWEHPATKQNIETLRARGVQIIEPGIGRLTGSDSGVGRLAEPEDIVSQSLRGAGSRDFEGKTVLVVTGGTQEPIDSVRYIGNRSSGKQGLALADAAQSRGAFVKLIAINCNSEPSSRREVKNAETVADVQEILSSDWARADVLLMPAAIGDFRVLESAPGKIHRGENDLTLQLVANPDLLAEYTSRFNSLPNRPYVVGFSAHATTYEKTSLAESAQEKLAKKGIDAIVANDVSDGQVFDSDSNSVLIMSSKQSIPAEGSKQEVAGAILDFVSSELS
jgi:phosphopantothenoylcysteine decarboxylase/phosphopantothenate--cysteine ligase